MTLIITPIDSVDEIQQVALIAFPDPAGHPAGFPNFPVWCTADGAPAEFVDATHAMWDGNFTATSRRLLQAIGADPTKIPGDVTGLDRDAVLALYADDLAALEAAEAAEELI